MKNTIKIITTEECKQKYIPDIDWLFTNFSELFYLGGFVAGGSLRRAIRSRSISKAYDVDYIWLTKALYNKGKNYKGVIAKSNQPDIDFYFRDETGFEAAIRHCEHNTIKYTKCQILRNNYAEQKQKAISFYTNGIEVKIQLILPETAIGSPQDIIDRFDFYNCKFAIDNIYFYYNEFGLQSEQQGILELDKSHINEKTLIQRFEKYYYKIGGYQVTPEFKRWLLERFILGQALRGIHVGNPVLHDQEFYSYEDLTILYCGKYRQHVNKMFSDRKNIIFNRDNYQLIQAKISDMEWIDLTEEENTFWQ